MHAPMATFDTLRGGTRARATILAWAALTLYAPRLAGQAPGWSGSVEANGNVLFGSARSRLAAGAISAGRADSALDVRGDAQFAYADAEDERARRSVTARSSRVGVAVDARPYARVSPFAFAALEGSLQQRIARRTGGGAGAKLTLRRVGEDDFSVSLALLAEHTRTLAPEGDEPASTTRLRWSTRLRYQRRFTEGVRFSHVTFYQPAVDRLDRYTTDSNSALVVSLTRAIALTTTLRQRYDSEARRRGARSNLDGQLLFGARASF